MWIESEEYSFFDVDEITQVYCDHPKHSTVPLIMIRMKNSESYVFAKILPEVELITFDNIKFQNNNSDDTYRFKNILGAIARSWIYSIKKPNLDFFKYLQENFKVLTKPHKNPFSDFLPKEGRNLDLEKALADRGQGPNSDFYKQFK